MNIVCVLCAVFCCVCQRRGDWQTPKVTKDEILTTPKPSPPFLQYKISIEKKNARQQQKYTSIITFQSDRSPHSSHPHDDDRDMIRNVTKRVLSTINESSFVFDKGVKHIQRTSAANIVNSQDYDYIRDEVANRLVDRLDDIRREAGFPLALDIGSGAGHVYRAICSDDSLDGIGGIGGIRKLVQMDSNEDMLRRDERSGHVVEGKERCDTYRMVADEEDILQFPDGTFDLVISSMALHRVNDLPKLFSEVRRVLKDDGCFMFAMVGGSSLVELRSSLVLAEMEREGGISPHIHPMVDVSDVGNLLSSAGFQLPTIDVDTISVGYSDSFLLMEHLQRMGENNASLASTKRSKNISIDTLLSSASIYQHLFPLDNKNICDEIEASIQVVYAIGWTPHKSQQKPLERGSATHKFGNTDVNLNTEG